MKHTVEVEDQKIPLTNHEWIVFAMLLYCLMLDLFFPCGGTLLFGFIAPALTILSYIRDFRGSVEKVLVQPYIDKAHEQTNEDDYMKYYRFALELRGQLREEVTFICILFLAFYGGETLLAVTMAERNGALEQLMRLALVS